MTSKSIVIDAPADAVWDVVADPIRLATMSPECVGCRWIRGASAPAVGARFRGTSRKGRHRWTTTSTIADLQPGRLFAWEVTYFRRPVARWEYRIEPRSGGVELVETVHDRRGRVLRAVSPFITGSADRATRNAATMESTLAAVKAAAERAS